MMKSETAPDTPAIPPALLAEVKAAAEEEHRPIGDVLRDLVEQGLMERRKSVTTAHAGHIPAKLSAAKAVARLIEQRKDHVLPDGVTIRKLMTHGRA